MINWHYFYFVVYSALLLFPSGQCLRMKWKDLVFAAAPDFPSEITPGSLTKVTFCVPFKKKWYHRSTSTLSRDVIVQLVSRYAKEDGSLKKTNFATLSKGMRMEMKDKLQSGNFRFKLHFPTSNAPVYLKSPRLNARFPKTNNNDRAVCFGVRGQIPTELDSSQYRFEVNAPGLSEALVSGWIPVKDDDPDSAKDSDRVQEWLKNQRTVETKIQWAVLQSVGHSYHVVVKKYERTLVHLQYNFFSTIPGHSFLADIKSDPESVDSPTCQLEIITTANHQVQLSKSPHDVCIFRIDEAVAVDPVLKERILPIDKKLSEGKLYYFDIYISGSDIKGKAKETAHEITITSSKASGAYRTNFILRKTKQDGVREHIKLEGITSTYFKFKLICLVNSSENNPNHKKNFTCVGKCTSLGKLVVRSDLVLPNGDTTTLCKKPLYLNIEAFEAPDGDVLGTYAVPFICHKTKLTSKDVLLESAFPLDCLPKIRRNLDHNIQFRVSSPYTSGNSGSGLHTTYIGVPKHHDVDNHIILSDRNSDRAVSPMPIKVKDGVINLEIMSSQSEYAEQFSQDRPKKIRFNFFKIVKNENGLLVKDKKPIDLVKIWKFEQDNWKDSFYSAKLNQDFFKSITAELNGEMFIMEGSFLNDINEKLANEVRNSGDGYLNANFGVVYGNPFRSLPLVLLGPDEHVYSEELQGKDARCHFPYTFAFLAAENGLNNSGQDIVPKIQKGNVIIQIFNVHKKNFADDKINVKLRAGESNSGQSSRLLTLNYDYTSGTAWAIYNLYQNVDNGFFEIADSNNAIYRTKSFKTL